MKKIYLLLVALLVSCLYSTQARADNPLTIDFTTMKPTTGSLPSAKGPTTFAYNTTPGIQFSSNSARYFGTPSKLTIYGSNAGTTLTISTTDDTKKITKIVFNGYEAKGPTLTPTSGSVSTNSDSNLEWTSDDESGSSSVTIKVVGTTTKTIKFTGVTITYVDGGGNPTPKLTVNKEELDMQYAPIPYEGYITLTGKNLTNNVTATLSDPTILTIEPTYCTPAEAEAGQVFKVTLKAASAPAIAPTITFASDGVAKPLVVTFKNIADANWPAAKIECETISQLKEKLVESGTEATYTGADALVTYVYDNYIYVEDKGAAIRLEPAEGVVISSVKPGDKLTNLEIKKIATGYELTSFADANVASSGTVTPTPVSAADLALAANEYRLVEVKYGLFETGASLTKPNPDGGGNIPNVAKLDVLGTDVNVSVFNATPFIDYTIEKGVYTVAGICEYDQYTNTSTIYLLNRDDDIKVDTNVTIPELTLTPETVVINTGTQTTASETSFNVTGTNLSSSVTVSTATVGVTVPTTEFAADQFANGAAVTVPLNWIPNEVKEGTGNVTVATTFGYDGKTLTAKANLNLRILGTPVITTNPVGLEFAGTEEKPIKLPASEKIKVTGSNLVGAIRIVCPVGITATPNIFEMTNNQVNDSTLITVNVTEANFDKVIELYTEGLAKPVEIYVTGQNVTPMDGTATLAEVREAESTKPSQFYSGEAVVTYSDETGFYMQDATAGLYVQYSGDERVNKGDKITSVQLVYINGNDMNGWFFGTKATIPQYIVLASDQTVEPTVVGADALAADGAQYADMLVKVNEVKLTSTEGDTFTAGNTYNGTTPTGHVSVAPFAGDIVDTEVPAKYVDVTGIYATLTGDSRALRPRVLTDITESENQTPLIAFITKSENAYTNTVQNIGVSVGLGEFACEFYNLPAGSHAIVTYEPAGAVIKLSKQGEEDSATDNYMLTDGTYTLALTATPATGYYRDITVKFIFGSEATAENTREYTFEPLKVQDPASEQTTTLASESFEEGQPGTFKLVQNDANAVTTSLTVTLANCYDVVVVENPVQHPYGITANTLTLALADEQGGEQPVAYAARAAQDDSDAQPLTLYPGQFGNATYNLTLTMDCTEAPSATAIAEPLEFNFVAQGDPNKFPLATLKVNYEVSDIGVGIESVEVDTVLYRVYTLQGLLLLDNASATEVAKLPAGLYIVNGKKVSIMN